jgi:lysozyme
MWLDKTKFPIRGIDLSHWNHPIDYIKISENIDFVFLKITEGTTFRDRLFEFHYQEFSKTDLAIGVYHFFNFEINGKEQAVHFMNAINARQFQLPLVVDVEQAGNQTIPDYLVIEELKSFVDLIIEKTGRFPMIYTNGDGYNRFVKDNFDDHLIWLAGNNIDRVNTINPMFWQFNQQGRIAGAECEIDLNVFRGTRKDWEELIKKSSSNHYSIINTCLL